MGLPVFVAPPSPTEPTAAEKTAAESRSSIRRQRPTERSHLNGRSSRESHTRRMVEMGMLSSNPGEYEVWEGQRRSIPDGPRLTSFAAAAHARAHRLQSLNDRVRVNDSYEGRFPPGIEDGPLMPPVPESRDYNAYEQLRRSSNRPSIREIPRMARRNPAPTPPYRELDSEPQGARYFRPLSTALSPPDQPHPRLRNSIGYVDFSWEDPEASRQSHSYGLSPYTSDALTNEQRPSRPNMSDRDQTLNTVGESPRRFRPAAVDGLGDRDRSLSPEGGAVWDTLLGSITPDPQPPSVGSSFASASASASAAVTSNRGRTSASTSMTSLAEDSVLQDCDTSDPEDDDLGDDDDELDDLHAFRAARGDRFWRTYADLVTARADRVARITGHTEHLGGMHRIISRLASREDIPDEWWAGAGLRREPPTS